jgi:hypothetical protein
MEYHSKQHKEKIVMLIEVVELNGKFVMDGGMMSGPNKPVWDT